MQIPRTTLTKDSISLEPLEERHWHGILESVRDPSVWKYMSFADLSDGPAVRKWFEAALVEPDKGIGAPFAIVDRGSGAVLGSTSLYDIQMRHRRCELGRSWLIPAVRRTGVNTGAKLLLLTHAFETMELERVQLKASAGNQTSRSAIESLGAVFEGILRNFATLPGGVRTDTALYSIILEDWPRVKQNLVARLERRSLAQESA
ncbi:MAG TPA: GNAT family protein [Bryobacteraceae bacterium]|nr:GNAT family protein [Bryobacteraceae bacterium]